MFKLINKLYQWLSLMFKSLYNYEDVPSEQDMSFLDELINKEVHLNRETRRHMAKVLRKHPDHRTIKHTDLPQVCRTTEHLYWLRCVNEVLTNSTTTQQGSK
jgi:hypothetical protein